MSRIWPIAALVFAVLAALLLGPLSRICDAADPLTDRGRTIYKTRCAKCHGGDGRGVAKRYEKPLSGSATVAELTELIAETMPEDKPESCVGKDAEAVAAFIHQTFYKPDRPRIKLARLTGPQLRQSLADLYASFAHSPPVNDKRGLWGEYYNSKRPQSSRRKIQRVDPRIDFDFADQGPGEGIDAKEFSIQWNGGLLVPITGRYEIVLRATTAFVCYLGDYDREFINNHVQSGDKIEFRRELVLTGGRVYPLRIVAYQRKRKTKQPPARISLSWVPPEQVEQVIPTRNLTPDRVSSTFAVQAKLPPDDRSYGYERGIAVDRQWDESTTAAALEFGDLAARELWPRYRRRHRGDSDEDRGRLRRFLMELATTAFRGPLGSALRQQYVDRQVDASEDDQEAIKRALLVTLKSPRFLYPLLDAHRDRSQRAANRLSLILHDSLPVDKWLRDQANQDRLETDAQLRLAARRLVDDYRTRAKVRGLMYAWLNLGDRDLSKDADLFPEFNAELISDLRNSLDAQLDEIVWSEAADYRQLIRGDWTFTNQRLQQYYGDAWRPAEGDGSGLKKSVTDARHAGVLSHPYLLSRLAYPDSTSPIHRGVFLLRHMLGRTLRPPQEAFTPLSPKLHPDLTTRERIALQTRPKNCQVCHIKINGLGFTLENFDAVGRYRLKEKDREIDSSGHYTDRVGKPTQIKDLHGLVGLLADSDDAHRAFVERAFEHLVKQPPAAYGSGTMDRLVRSFQRHDYNIRELLVEIAVIAARQPSEKAETP